jgi:antirestriction protein ArdC
MSRGQSRTGTDRTSLYDDITNKIIAELEAGCLPWVQPWGTRVTTAPLAMPQNATTGRPYSGSNVLLLWGAVIAGGFSRQSWLTFRQALLLGSRLIDRQSQKMTVAARAMAERNTLAHLS